MSTSTVVSYLREIDFLSGKRVSTNQARAPHFFSFLLRVNPSLKFTPAKVLERSASWEGTHFLVKHIKSGKVVSPQQKNPIH